MKNWSVNRVAQLGCATGECPSTSTPRKFFFPPAVLTVRPAGASGSYEAISIVSGDREHPLRDSSPSAAFNVKDRFFLVKDLGTTVNDTALNTKDVTAADTDLFNATYTLWDGTRKGFTSTSWAPAGTKRPTSPTPPRRPRPVKKP